MSCRIISREEFDKMMPVKPPIVNSVTNPIDQYEGEVWIKGRPQNVANHLNTLMPVGTAMIIVVAVK